MAQTRVFPYALSVVLGLITLALLAYMGRNIICPCGYVSIWQGPGSTDLSSQHLFDLYTPSHLLHGFLFYGALFFVGRWISIEWRFVIAMVVECAWEIVENTEAVIERYRTTTVSSEYNGDSVVNSFADVLAMALGFALSRVLPVWASVAIVIGFEVFTVFLIRDGLALNILMILAPSEAVLQWQTGG